MIGWDLREYPCSCVRVWFGSLRRGVFRPCGAYLVERASLGCALGKGERWRGDGTARGTLGGGIGLNVLVGRGGIARHPGVQAACQPVADFRLTSRLDWLPTSTLAQAVRQHLRALAFGMARERNASGWCAPGRASICACTTSPSGTARGPILESSKFKASAPTLRQRRFGTSLRRQPVSASRRIAVTASGHSSSWMSSPCPSRASSPAPTNRET